MAVEREAAPVNIETVPIDSLHFDPSNVRKHDAKNIDAIKASIARFGQQKPIVIDADGVVRAGNGTLSAMRALSFKEIDVVRTPLRGSEATAYAIADNRTAELAEWDDDALAQTLAALQIEDEDLAIATGFDASEIDRLTAPDEVIEDEVPEPPVIAITKRGDVWLLGAHRVMCGDSTSVEDVARLMRNEIAEMMFTDPPYGVSYTGGHFHSGDVNVKRERESLAADDSTAIYFEFLPVALAVVDGPCYVWFADSKAREIYKALFENKCELHSLIIWNKTNATYAAMNAQYKQRHEPCIYFKPKGSTLRWCGASTEATVWDEARDGINEFHPTQKPVALAAKAIKNHDAAIVLDLFLGSGSTLIAAEQVNRKCYGMEISPQYCDVIVARWEKLTGKKAQLDETS